jgi:hypothetical protein
MGHLIRESPDGFSRSPTGQHEGDPTVATWARNRKFDTALTQQTAAHNWCGEWFPTIRVNAESGGKEEGAIADAFFDDAPAGLHIVCNDGPGKTCRFGSNVASLPIAEHNG